MFLYENVLLKYPPRYNSLYVSTTTKLKEMLCYNVHSLMPSFIAFAWLYLYFQTTCSYYCSYLSSDRVSMSLDQRSAYPGLQSKFGPQRCCFWLQDASQKKFFANASAQSITFNFHSIQGTRPVVLFCL